MLAFARSHNRLANGGVIRYSSGVPQRPIANGRARVDMPIELHRLSIENAEKNGVSLNQWLVALIAGGQNFKLPKERR